MILVTLNVSGVEGPTKKLALKRFLEKVKHDILLIQETMVREANSRELFVKLLPNWYMCVVDSNGMSGGLL